MKRLTAALLILILLSTGAAAFTSDYTTRSSFTDTYQVEDETTTTNNSTVTRWDATYLYDIQAENTVRFESGGNTHVIADLTVTRTSFGDWVVSNGGNATGNLWKAKIRSSFAQQSKYRGKEFGQDMSSLQYANLKDSLRDPPIQAVEGELVKVNGEDYSGGDVNLGLDGQRSASFTVEMKMDSQEARLRLGHGSVDWSTVTSAQVVYRFNETSSPAIDYSGNNNDGVWYGGGFTSSTAGISKSQGDWDTGEAYSFDGIDDYVNTTTSFNFDTTTEFTIAAWVRGTNMEGGEAIINQRDGSTQGQGWQLRAYSTGTEIVGEFNLRDASTGNQVNVRGSTVIDDGDWHLVVGEFDPGLNEAKLWVDGSLEASGSISDDFSTDVYTIVGGSTHDPYFTGDIDEPKIFNKELNSTEINNLYQYNQLTEPTDSAPTFSGEDPLDGSTNINVDTDLEITVDDPDGDGLQIIDFYWGNGTFIDGSTQSVTSPHTETTDPLSLESGTTYNWYVQACDSNNNCANSTTYSFTTATNSAPSFSNPDPADGATVTSDTDLTLTADDPEGDGIQQFDIYWANGTFIDGITQSVTVPYTFSTDTLSLVGGESYQWYARACDSNNNCQNSTTYSFDRASPPEIVPNTGTAIGPDPADGATGINDTQFTGPPDIGVIFNGVTIRDNDTSSWIQYDVVLENQTGGYTMFETNSTPSWDTNDEFVTQDTEAYGLDTGTTYNWHLEAADAQYSVTGPTWSFTTNSTPNDPPTYSSPDPADGATDISVSTDLEITIDDPDGDGIQIVDFYWGNGTRLYSLNQTNTPPATVSTDALSLQSGTNYSWYVESCDDQGACSTSSTYEFSTVEKTLNERLNENSNIIGTFAIAIFWLFIGAEYSVIVGIISFLSVIFISAAAGILPQWIALLFVVGGILFIANKASDIVSGG